MEIIKTEIEDLFIIELKAPSDERGFFMELYNKFKYKDMGIIGEFLQDNVSISHKGVVRGLHFQINPHSQGKLVSVLNGSVFDVAVDLRPQSKTFGKYETVILSAENKKQFFIPEGFAHGFMSLEDNTLFAYKCTNVWNKESERGIVWNDKELSIPWPEGEKIVSEKDNLLESFTGFKKSIGAI